MRQTVVRGPRRFANRYALVLRIHTAHRILHQDFTCHPYKVVVVKALNDQDTITQKNVCKDILKALGDNNINHVLMMDYINFHFVAMSVFRTVSTGQLQTFAIYIGNLYILRRLLFGVV